MKAFILAMVSPWLIAKRQTLGENPQIDGSQNDPKLIEISLVEIFTVQKVTQSTELYRWYRRFVQGN